LWKQEPFLNFIFQAQPNVLAELAPQLSSNALVLVPENPLFKNAAIRWDLWSAPAFQAVVEVATEEDVQKTVGRDSENI
jgi:hypothetical protein